MDDRADILNAYISDPSVENFSKLNALLHPSDASFFKILFNNTLQKVLSLEQEKNKLETLNEENECDTENYEKQEKKMITNESSFETADIISSQLSYLVECSSLTIMPFLQPSTRESVLKLYLRYLNFEKRETLEVEKQLADVRYILNTLLHGNCKKIAQPVEESTIINEIENI